MIHGGPMKPPNSDSSESHFCSWSFKCNGWEDRETRKREIFAGWKAWENLDFINLLLGHKKTKSFFSDCSIFLLGPNPLQWIHFPQLDNTQKEAMTMVVPCGTCGGRNGLNCKRWWWRKTQRIQFHWLTTLETCEEDWPKEEKLRWEPQTALCILHTFC